MKQFNLANNSELICESINVLNLGSAVLSFAIAIVVFLDNSVQRGKVQ